MFSHPCACTNIPCGKSTHRDQIHAFFRSKVCHRFPFSSRTGQSYHHQKTKNPNSTNTQANETFTAQHGTKSSASVQASKTNILSTLNTYQLGSFLTPKGQGVVGFIPLSVWCAVNEYNAIFDQGLCAHQLIVRCIVYHINDSGFAGTTYKEKGAYYIFHKSKT